MFKRLVALPIDWLLVIIPILLLITGTVTIYTMSYTDHGWRLATDQIIMSVIGVAVYLYFMFADYRNLNRFAFLLYLAAIALLVPLLPAFASQLPFVTTVYGASRWINLGFFQLQPSEVFKFLGTAALAAYLSNTIGRYNFKRVFGFIVLCVIPLTMIYLQPNLGTMLVVLVIMISMFLSARPPMRLVAAMLILLTVLTPIIYYNMQPYQRDRVNTFLNPQLVTKAQRHNVEQSMIAVGSGGLLGRGFGQGSQTVLNFLPVAHADFIFAGFAEATGLVGAGVMLLLFVVLLLRLTVTAQISNDMFGRIFVMGLVAKIFFQLTIHVGMNVGMLPVSGIPLPLVSYGGTALIIDMAMLGVAQNIYIRHKRTFFTK